MKIVIIIFFMYSIISDVILSLLLMALAFNLDETLGTGINEGFLSFWIPGILISAWAGLSKLAEIIDEIIKIVEK